ncbi:hypothetical protein OC844_007338 [Tilletia horrida]|nr:hypothetical protein OC844_007338 [Tilletia horrida]
MSSPSSTSSCPRVRHLVTGTFNTASLHLLAFDTLTTTLTLSRSIPNAQGPHQFLALGNGPEPLANSLGVAQWKTVYATTWANPPSLSAWSVKGLDIDAGSSLDLAANVDLDWLSTVPITATSSYVHVQPPPFHSLTSPSYGVEPGSAQFLYSAGGPTGEVHRIDPLTGALASDPGKVQELIFLREGGKALPEANKTRKALRYGAHSVDVSTDQLAFVADLGRNAILTYRRDLNDGRLTYVTEHTSFVDVFELMDNGTGLLEYRLSLDILPEGADRASYRGDTVRLSPSGRAVLASTRGKTPATRGWVTAWDLDALTATVAAGTANLSAQDEDECLLSRWRTPTSGGKANAIEWAPRYDLALTKQTSDDTKKGKGEENDWAVLTDDAEGYVLVLRWNGRGLEEVARTKLPGKGVPELGEGEHEGASHAIWLS